MIANEPLSGPAANVRVGEEDCDSIGRCEAILTQETAVVNRVATNSTADQVLVQFITRHGELIDCYTIDANDRASSAFARLEGTH